jgi:hypothetical protein
VECWAVGLLDFFLELIHGAGLRFSRLGIILLKLTGVIDVTTSVCVCVCEVEEFRFDKVNT